MKKKIAVLAIMLSFVAPARVFAESINNYAGNTGIENSGIKVAVLDDVLKNAVKDAVYNLGTRMLNKLTAPTYNNDNNYQNDTNTNTNTGTNTNTNSNTSTTTTQQNLPAGDYIPGQQDPPEQMIPVS